MTQKEAFRMKGALWNAKQRKTTNYNSWAKEGQRKSPKMNQPNWKGTHRKHSEKNRALQIAKKNKTTDMKF